MAKTTRKSSLAKNIPSSRPTRLTAPVSFANKNVDSDIEIVEIKKEDDPSDDEDIDLSKLLQEIQKRQSKKTSLVSAAYENQKKALYSNARQKAKDMSRDGTVYLENIKPSVLAMRENETSYERELEQFRAFWDAQDAAAASLFGLYPPIIDEVFTKRSEMIDDASRMIKLNPGKRQKALNRFLQNAHDQVEQSRQNKMVATDASELIKHYKALLLS
ncbi:hypothetical protein K435DRAFT_307500 [Dendrothele bispora CBS 962.96]|uniref:Uncharacterized protein n=1 Tax=Dendrothele bispora (strain CBS 962.96) TaxID=1314807 RepID=A0A4S8LIE9_DENBC|nr:hypothetical protein K435DRAFT_307500 [Dendrothele bispora CBS 962.96]